MKIDETIEAQVREAFSCVVGKDGDGMVAAITALGEERARTAVSYAIYVCGYIVNDVYRDGASRDQLLEMAAGIIDGEKSWVDLGEPDGIADFLDAAAQGKTTSTDIPAADVIGAAFVCGGHLLATRLYRHDRWFEYLDEIWNTAAAAPEPSN